MSADIRDNPAEVDPVLEVLDEVSSAIKADVQDERDLLQELDRVRDAHQRGDPLREALGRRGRPRAIVLTAQIANRITRSSARLQRVFAATLAREGESVTAIARRFEVSHQRISSILKRTRGNGYEAGTNEAVNTGD